MFSSQESDTFKSFSKNLVVWDSILKWILRFYVDVESTRVDVESTV